MATRQALLTFPAAFGGHALRLAANASNSPATTNQLLAATTCSSGPSTSLTGSVVSATGNNHCLFVYNLAPESEEADLWKLFGPFGAVLQVNLVKDATSGMCKGFAFVTMGEYEQALRAIETLNGATLSNRVLQVSFKTKSNKQAQQNTNTTKTNTSNKTTRKAAPS